MSEDADIDNLWRDAGVADGMEAAITAVGEDLDDDLVQQLLGLDYESDYAAWKERIVAALKSSPPPADLDHLQFVLIYAPIARDKEGMYSEAIVGGHPGHVPDDNDFEAYYEGYCPYPDYLEGCCSALTELYQLFMDEDGNCADDDALDALEMTFVRLCVSQLCQDAEAAPLLLGKSTHRFVYAGRNEVLDLLGAVTRKGWRLLPEGGTRAELSEEL